MGLRLREGFIQEHQASTSAFTWHQSNDGLFNECPWERRWFWRGLQSWLFVSLFWHHKLTDHDSSNRGNWRVAARRSRKPGQRLKDMLMLLHCEQTDFAWFWWKVLWGWLLRCLPSLVGVTVTTVLLGTRSVWLGHWRLDAKHFLKWSSLWFQNASKCWKPKYRFKLRIFPLSKLQSSCCFPRTASVMSKLLTCWSLQSLTLQWSKKISCQGRQIVIFRYVSVRSSEIHDSCAGPSVQDTKDAPGSLPEVVWGQTLLLFDTKPIGDETNRR